MKYKIYVAEVYPKYKGPIPCFSIEDVENELEKLKQTKYNFYLVVSRDEKLDMDQVFEAGPIEHDINKKMVKTPKKLF